ncbi:MAG: FHA domain-containing protein [Myxococcales bacterium]|nr:FHA domain-containing protein [Myxococcales bacterium]
MTPIWSAILEVQDPDGARTRHPFRHPRIRVGRARDNDLSLADEGVSHQHCEFVAEHGWFVVRDLRSQNGTWLNDERIGEARLRDGDEIRIGATRIHVALEGDVRRPNRRDRWRALAALFGLAAAGLVVWRLWARESTLRARYVSELRLHLQRDPCVAPQLADVAAVDRQLAGRSIAIALDKGEVKIAKADEEADRELLAIYRREAELTGALSTALTQAQQGERESLERLVRLGQRFSTGRNRKVAAFAEAVLRDRENAADDLVQGVLQHEKDTERLAALTEAVVVRREAESAAALAHFQFASTVAKLVESCRTEVARLDAGATGALKALEE